MTRETYNPSVNADCYPAIMSPLTDESVTTMTDDSNPVTPQPDQSQFRKLYYHL